MEWESKPTLKLSEGGMKMNWLIILTVVISLMVGGCSGLFIAAMMISASNADDEMEKWCEEKNTYESN